MKESRDVQGQTVAYQRDQHVELSLSQSTLEIIDYALWGVVNEGGTAGGVGFPRELNVGGKTGTAQVIAREKVRTKEHKDHSWFISFAPMHTGSKPEIGVVCITENGGWGASASAPKVKMIQAAYFSKKFGRPILPEMVAFNLEGVAKPEPPPQQAQPTIDLGRPKAPVRR
jgi:cell division protein FtsI/penicillin-binding protein 2